MYSSSNDYVFKSKRLFVELNLFAYKQLISCVFPAFIFLMLAISSVMDLQFISRYDFLFVACIVAQYILVKTGIESKREVLVIMGFHIIGFILEVHKVNVGSWSYPEDAITKIAGVPLYSGFMYSSVASYICRAWENFDLRIKNWPRNLITIPLGLAIYINFFSNAFIADFRWYIAVALVIAFSKSFVEFNTNGYYRRMPILLSFILIGFFIWIAENLATFLNAWKYAYQHSGWEMVDFGKWSSWSLLVIVSFIIVAQLKLLKRNE